MKRTIPKKRIITSQEMRAKIRADKAARPPKGPVGLIGESTQFAYGFNGCTYYVTEGALNHLVTRAAMSLEEAKNLYEALKWVGGSAPPSKSLIKMLNKSRKGLLNGDAMFWFFVEQLRAF